VPFWVFVFDKNQSKAPMLSSGWALTIAFQYRTFLRNYSVMSMTSRIWQMGDWPCLLRAVVFVLTAVASSASSDIGKEHCELVERLHERDRVALETKKMELCKNCPTPPSYTNIQFYPQYLPNPTLYIPTST
jgi:hypothetical protein